ncbi:MAG: hypothetical protein E5Y87_04310 [Mesorhizobium sp.]|nr:MAG: hypothetical protein E5Y87_04310 [Mesorhizobium sp.]
MSDGVNALEKALFPLGQLDHARSSISLAAFGRLRDDGIIIRSTSDLTSNTYVINPAPVTPQVEEVQEAS